MKILLTTHYYWPDTAPYAVMLRTIAEALSAEGHDVTVYSTQPAYKDSVAIERQPKLENVSGVKVIRKTMLPETKRNYLMRMLNILIFVSGLFLHVIRNPSYRVVMISTAPPILGAWIARIAARQIGAKFIYHCQDIHPEAAYCGGLIKKGLFYHFLRWVDTRNCYKADAIVVLSRDMESTVLGRYSERKENIAIINNFVPPVYMEDVGSDDVTKYLKSENKFRIIFAGNLGQYQGLDRVINAALLLVEEKNLEFVFLGEGIAKQELQRAAGSALGKTIMFFPHQSAQAAKKIIRDADLGLITLSPDVYKVAYPSKTMTYLEQGCPLLVAMEPESELYRFVIDREIGIAAPLDDEAALAETIRNVYQHSERMARLKQNALAAYSQNFTSEIAGEKWKALFNNISIG